MIQKTVLITGCSKGGIGDSLAQEFQRKGLHVFATARDLAKVEHLKELGLDVLPLDVVDEDSIKKAVETVKITTGGTLDFLVNNSGAGYSMPLLDTEVSVAKRMFNVNVFALMTVTQAFMPLLIESKGSVINIGSIAGKAPMPWQGYYNASKAAVNHLSDQLRLELSPFGVKVIHVVTGAIRSHFFDNLPITKLPVNSIYNPGREEIEQVLNGNFVRPNATDVDVYARGVVKNALKTKPNVNYWIGDSSFVIWFLSTFLWHTIWDIFFTQSTPFKANVARKKIEAARKSTKS